MPPYHPQLNPIEVAWAITKNYVSENNDGSDFNKVKLLIREGFKQVTAERWEKLIYNAYLEEMKFVYRDKIELPEVDICAAEAEYTKIPAEIPSVVIPMDVDEPEEVVAANETGNDLENEWEDDDYVYVDLIW